MLFSYNLASLYEIWKVYVKTYWPYRVKTKLVTKLRSSLDLWPFDPKMYKHLPLTILHPCMKYESCTLKITKVIVSEAKCWQSSVVTLTFDFFDPKIYRCLSFPILYLCMKYKVCGLRDYWVITLQQSVDRQSWQSSVVTLTFDLLTPKSIGVFLFLSSICVWIWSL